MQYGEKKARDMARSILPSKARRGARESAAIVKRHNRRRTRLALHDWKRHSDPLEYEGHIYDYSDSAAAKGGIDDVVWERRDADKLAPFIRWAIAVTRHLDDPFERYMTIKKIVPDNLIGRHALGHLRYVDEFVFEDFWWSTYRGSYARPVLLTRAQVHEAVTFELKKVNRDLKARGAETCFGVTDESFYEKAMKDPRSGAAMAVRNALGLEDDTVTSYGRY